MKAAVVALALAASAGTAWAQPAVAVTDTEARRDRAISVGLWSLSGFAGLQAQYEAPLPIRPRWSWIAGGGVRFAARSDYGSRTLAVGAEARYWITGRTVWARLPARSPAGWFAGARLDLAWTRTRDKVADAAIGDNLSTALTATGGYRFVIKRKVELTPMVGLGLTRETDLEGRLGGWTRGTGRLGMTLGWMF